MSYRLLVVEDEKWVRTALRKVIGKVDLPVHVEHEAANGMEALDWLRAHDADLVLTDIRMPVMDGLTLLEELGASECGADAVIVSGHDDFQYAQQAMRKGAFDYLLKPVEKEELEACLSGWIAKRQQAGRSGGTAAPETVDVRELSPVEQIIHYIKSNREYDLSSAEAADRVHLNPSYFSKLFRQTTGMTFTDYVTSMRMQEAAGLLQRTSLRVTEIAERLRFKDPAYFANTFKKTIGHSPSEYRKHHRHSL
ncbi:response regulator transcription factor [Paenibacillus soyae]|uniref:Response regulator n=1 Tax=Paenibacillus soyae TaxID=2969249 RepID=A0A9X2SE13_9BACL|nr:response regulator [Paenibacillus soyae]MCR2807712.1 response regulator [Paenibacillus soyae]